MKKVVKFAIGVFAISLYSGIKISGVLTTKTYNNPDDVASGESELVRARDHFSSNYIGDERNYSVPILLAPIVVLGYVQKSVRLAIDHQIRLVEFQSRILPEQYLKEA
ncbi:MAG TPA: hypothetical protein PKD68_01235 [Candidatus Saccharibacteria bacterium]|nr:hypothetical protein [Candidatus Saccharibacteria bacterium]